MPKIACGADKTIELANMYSGHRYGVATAIRTMKWRGVSVNSFLDTLGPKIRRHQPRHIVAPVSPGQGFCIHAVQSARSHCIAAETRVAPGGALPPYQSSGAITDSP